MCDFHAPGAVLTRLTGFNWVQSWKESPTLTWISPWHCGKCVGWLNRRLFSGTPGGCNGPQRAVCPSRRLVGKHMTPVSAGVCQGPLYTDLGSRSTCEAICQVEWDLFRKRKQFLQNILAINGKNRKMSENILLRKLMFFFTTWVLFM